MIARWVVAAAALLVGVAGGPGPTGEHPYMGSLDGDDSARVAEVAPAVAPYRTTGALAAGLLTPGLLAPWGLPPTQGAFLATDSTVVFHATDGTLDATYTIHGPVWLDSLRPTRWAPARPLVDSADTEAALAIVERLTTGGYADSLYQLFGRPNAVAGLVGSRGRAAGRLGEYIASRDSLALDPARMTGEAQLRHALAHELAHRWQQRARPQLAVLWQDMAPIRDPKRYGYGSVREHQAEAVAFAVHFLHATAGARADNANAAALLDYYELLVPGTRLLTRFLLLQPTYQGHPLR